MPVSASVEHLLGQLNKDQAAPLQIHYATTTVTKPGVKLTRAASKDAPTYSVSSSVLKNKDTKYILVAIDLDAPFVALPVLGPICHLIQTDLVASGEADADGYVKLDAGSVAPLAAYVAPRPPPLSGPHRYVFLLWEQPADKDAEKIRSEAGLAKEVSMPGRMWWDEAKFEEKVGLPTESLAGNYFVAN
jgi:phosphatidylethanolamine-binding protein